MTFIKGSKEHHFEGLKIDLNAAEISVQDCKHTANLCEWKKQYTVLKLRAKQVAYESKM